MFEETLLSVLAVSWLLYYYMLVIAQYVKVLLISSLWMTRVDEVVLNFQASQDVQFRTKSFDSVWIHTIGQLLPHPLGSLNFYFSLASETSQVEVLSCLLHSVISNSRSALPPTTSLLHESKQWALQPARKGGRKVHRVGVSGQIASGGEADCLAL